MKPFFYLFCLAALGAILVPNANAQGLQIDPAEVDFGAVKFGTPQGVTIAIKNLDSDEVEILVSVDGAPFSATPASLTLQGGGGGEVEVVFTAAAVGEYQGRLLLQVKNFLKTDEYPVPLRAESAVAALRISPDPQEGIDMGAVIAGQTARQRLVLHNLGEVSIALDDIVWADTSTVFQLVKTDVEILAPNKQLAIDVDFRPVASGVYRNRLIVHSTDLEPPQIEIALQGQGLAPQAAFSPLPQVGLDFGNLELGQSHILDLTVLNQGRADLLFKKVEIAGGAFTVSWDSSRTTPVGPDQRQILPITFRPRYEGRASGTLTVATNDPTTPQVDITLEGTAQQSPPHIEILNRDDINFGNVAIGKYERDHLVLWNRGGTPFKVGLDFEGEAGGEFELESPSLILQPGEFEKVELKFKPRETGDRRAHLQVGTESGPRQIDLYGVGNFFELTPTVLDFDRVVVGKSSTIQTEIANLGNADFTITDITSSHPKLFAVKAQVSPTNKYILAADSRRPLPVSIIFSPAARGVANGVLQVQGYWDEAFEMRQIPLSGTGIAADLELHPSGPFTFDYVVLGEKAAQTVIATNTGDTDLRVEAHAESGEVSVEPATFALQPGGSTSLTLLFSPQALGQRSARIRLISNDIKEKALPLQIKGKGELDNIDLARVISVLMSRKTHFDTLKVGWNNTPVVLPDQTKIDLVFHIPDSLRPALIGRKFNIEWTQLDENYDEQGGPKQLSLQIQDAGEQHVLAEKLNLRLLEKSNKRVRLKISTQNHPGAPVYAVSQIFEAGGWKWEFEAKPLVSFLSIRPGRDYTNENGELVKGQTERLIGLPGLAFFGWHNTENPSVSGVHLTAIGNVLEALSTENSIAISLGVAVSFYKDRFMFGIGRDVYDRRSKDKRKGTQDYIMTFKYWGLNL